MKLIVGLGNPENKYSKTRHNTGFMLVNKTVALNVLNWEFSAKFEAEIAKDENTLYIKPQTQMNRSGDAVAKLVNFYNIDPEKDLTIIHDDVDLELGNIKVQSGRGSAGHKGVEDIATKLGTLNFQRIRVGIGRPEDANIATEDWVLMPFSDDELKKILDLNLI